MTTKARIITANAVGIAVLALGMFGIDVDPEQKAQIIAGLGAIGCVINAVLVSVKKDRTGGGTSSQHGMALPGALANLAALAIGLVLLALVACASLEQNDIARLATQYSTLKYIEAAPGAETERAARIYDIVSQARQLLSGDTSTTVALIEVAVRNQVPWHSLSAADQLLTDGLISAISQDLKQQVGSGALKDEQLLQVDAVLGWVADICQRQLALTGSA